jgi:hypothetical protein
MKTLFKLTLLSLAVFGILGCQCDDDLSKNPMVGTYTGIFTANYSSGEQSGEVTLKLQEGRYTCIGNPDRIPAGGRGTYTVEEDKIIFIDENVWTADFDWNLILNGEYDYTFDGHKLIIWKDTNDQSTYRYELEK